MRRSTQRSARTMIVLLLLQVTLLGTWTSHALVPAGPAAAHVEAAGGADCPVVHDADHCLICQAMTLRLLGASVVRLELDVTVLRGLPAGATLRSSPQTPTNTQRPRAPPVTVA